MGNTYIGSSGEGSSSIIGAQGDNAKGKVTVENGKVKAEDKTKTPADDSKGKHRK